MLLGLDLGTTNVKAVVTEDDGRVLARGSAPVALRHDGDAVTQDIDEIFAATVAAVRVAWPRRRSVTMSGSVRAIGVSAQGGALQMLDGDDRPIGPVVSWLDARGKPYDRRITDRLGSGELARRTGHPRGTMGLGQLLRLGLQSPEVLRPPRGVGFVGDVIVGRLCGRRAHDATSLSCAVLYNPSLGRADPEMLKEVGLREDQLPDLLDVRTAAGGLSEAVARQMGLAAGVPVAPAVHDQYAAALGVGAIAPGDVMFGAGTAWVLLAVSERLSGPAAGVGFVCRHVVEGLYGQIVSMGNGGSAITWATGLMGLEGAGREDIDAMLVEAGAGAAGVRFRPLLAPTGAAGLSPTVTGRLSGLRLAHGRPQVLRAVVEGLAMELARYLRMLSDAGAGVDRLIMTGGAAGSAVTPQIVADVTGLPVARATEPDTGAVGAAMIARGLVGPETALHEIARANPCLPAGAVVRPSPDRATYETMLAEYLADLGAADT